MSTPTVRQPDILLIMPDQMRGDCLSLENHPVLLTPNIDTIGLHGTHFARAYTTCPSCIPARRAMLTGLFPATNGVVGYRERHELPETTFPARLQACGYRTTLVGRHMHQYPYEKPYGFEDRVLCSGYREDDDYALAFEAAFPGQGGFRGHGLSNNGWTSRPWQFPDAWHPTNWIANRVREKLCAATDDRPHFITASFFAPHPPLLPPACYYERYYQADLPERAVGDWAVPPGRESRLSEVDRNRIDLHGEALRQAQAGYFGLISHLDDQVQAMIFEFNRQCARRGRPGVVVFTSDHGEMLGDHYLFRKCEPYEGSARVPFLIQATPELGLVRGARHDGPVCLEDIGPTLIELAGGTPDPQLDGRSLVPILRGDATPVRATLHAEHAPCYDNDQAFHLLTDGRWKYIWRPVRGTEQLFDLASDPKECADLAADPGSRGELERWRTAMIAQLKDRPEGFTDGRQLIAGRPYPDVMGSDELPKFQ